MRRYYETRDASGELLRLVLALMSKHAAGLHPVSYCLWYEYAAGTNPALKQAVDRALASGKPLDDEQVYALYNAHIAERDNALTDKLQTDLERLLGQVLDQAVDAGQNAETYSEKLGRFGERLGAGESPHELKSIVAAIVEDTRRMRATADDLQGRLQESTQELNTLRAKLEQAKDEALTDPLTGIANRRGFEQAVAKARAANGESLARSCLMMLDIDHFKKCNDSYGHMFGDKVIRSVAQVLAKNVKGQDVPARIGGEEFAVLLPDTPAEGALALAERIRVAVAAGRIKRGDGAEMVGNITISLGVAEYAPGETLETLILRADEALYASKSNGRNRVTLAPAAKPSDTASRPPRAA